MWVRIAAALPGLVRTDACSPRYRMHADSNTGRHSRLAEELRLHAQWRSTCSATTCPRERAQAIVRARPAHLCANGVAKRARSSPSPATREAVRAHVRDAAVAPQPASLAACCSGAIARRCRGRTIA